jgi:hypothetical protein
MGALNRAVRYTLIPYGRNTSAMALTLARYEAVSTCAFAFTLVSTVPLTPIDAFARA